MKLNTHHTEHMLNWLVGDNSIHNFNVNTDDLRLLTTTTSSTGGLVYVLVQRVDVGTTSAVADISSRRGFRKR